MSGKPAGPGVVGEEGLSQQSEFEGGTGSTAVAYGKTGGFHALSQEVFDEIDRCPEKALCCTSSNWAVCVLRLIVTRVPGGAQIPDGLNGGLSVHPMAARFAASRRSIGCVTRMPLRCVC